MEKFNENLSQFTNIIKNLYPEQKDAIENYYEFNEPGDKYLKEFIENCSDMGDDISSKNEIIFSKGTVILNNIDFHTIWNDEKLSDEQKDNIWKYLHTLYIFAYEYIRNVDFKTLLKELKNANLCEDADEQTRTFMNIIDGLTNKYKDSDETDEKNDTTDSSAETSIPVPDLFGGVIGNLAKEIADEIDPAKVNLDDPQKLLKSLLSGNFDEENDDSGVVNLIKNITDKIQTKLSNGNLDETQLFSEAQNVMNSLGKGGGDGMSNPLNMFSTMMKSGMMSGLDPENQNIVNEAQQIINSGAPVPKHTKQQMQSKMELKSTRDRLRKKLEEKKKRLQEKQERENKPKIEEVKEEIDLDALADEIEGL